MINKIFALPVIEQITPVLSRRQLDELEVLVVDHPQVKASFALQGAHLLSWKPNGEEEVLWLSNNTPFKTGVALRGGVPICWPWFGPAAKQGLPSHGFARNLPWTLKAHNEDDNGVVLTFELQSNAETRQLWPHEFCLLPRFKQLHRPGKQSLLVTSKYSICFLRRVRRFLHRYEKFFRFQFLYLPTESL